MPLLLSVNFIQATFLIGKLLCDLDFERGDSVMADKGFTILDLLPLGVSLNLPLFLGSKGQMSAEDVSKTQSIASLRIHVERAINKIRNFHILLYHLACLGL